MQNITLLKVGGAELAPGTSLDTLVAALARMAACKPLIILHGGGPEIARWQQRLGLEPKAIDGLRVTDAASLEVAEAVLSGLVNKRLVGRLAAAGVKACGISGVDGGMLCARRLHYPTGDLGLVGEIDSVNTELLTLLLDAGYTPVVSPVSTGKDDLTLNVNADHAALAVARAMQVAEVIFITNVPGVLREGELLSTLTVATAREMIRDGIITGGMVPKVRSALDTLDEGINRVLITNLENLASGAGTWIKMDSVEGK